MWFVSCQKIARPCLCRKNLAYVNLLQHARRTKMPTCVDMAYYHQFLKPIQNWNNGNNDSYACTGSCCSELYEVYLHRHMVNESVQFDLNVIYIPTNHNNSILLEVINYPS